MKSWIRESLAFILWGLSLTFVIPPVESSAETQLDLWPAAAFGLLCFIASHWLLRGRAESAGLVFSRSVGYLILCWVVLERIRYGAL